MSDAAAKKQQKDLGKKKTPQSRVEQIKTRVEVGPHFPAHPGAYSSTTAFPGQSNHFDIEEFKVCNSGEPLYIVVLLSLLFAPFFPLFIEGVTVCFLYSPQFPLFWQKNFSINIQSMTPEEMVFDIVGIDPPLANALRRILLGMFPFISLLCC